MKRITTIVSVILSTITYSQNDFGWTTTIDASKSKKHIKHLRRVDDGLTASLAWLADMQYHITMALVEYGTVQEHNKSYFHDKLKGNIVVPGRTSTPYEIYSSYIRCYKDLSGVLNSYPAVLSELPIVVRLTEELYKDLQYVGEELEEIM